MESVMSTYPKRAILPLASALLLALGLAACASGPSSAPGLELQRRIESASTPGEHEALAAYYDSEAATARKRAEDHRNMARAYAGSRNSGSMAGHCDLLVRSHENLARQYAEMAAGHRGLAAQPKP